MASPAIELREVTLSFDTKRVFSGVSFVLGAGETLILLGVTGSGKSVLLKLLLGLLKPDSGEVLIEGQDLVPLSESSLQPLRMKMGIVFQEGALFDSLSVFDNVAYRLREEHWSDEAKIDARVREVLRFVEMEQAIDKMPSELSGGMRRRVAIARTIISNPSIMLYDSPTGGLDPVTSQTINVLIAKLRDLATRDFRRRDPALAGCLCPRQLYFFRSDSGTGSIDARRAGESSALDALRTPAGWRSLFQRHASRNSPAPRTRICAGFWLEGGCSGMALVLVKRETPRLCPRIGTIGLRPSRGDEPCLNMNACSGLNFGSASWWLSA